MVNDMLHGRQQTVIYEAISEWRKRLRACVTYVVEMDVRNTLFNSHPICQIDGLQYCVSCKRCCHVLMMFMLFIT